MDLSNYQPSGPVRVRFAPSPTGFMHIGNLRTALYTWLLARHYGGSFILRIEDTDQEREVPGAVEKIYEGLKVAGLDHDEGPDVGGPVGPYIQSQRRALYLQYAQELVEKGAAYYCFCTRERLDELRTEYEARGETFKYDKHCLQLSKEEVQARIAAGEPYVIRQNVPESGDASFDDLLYGHIQVDAGQLDDNVLLKSDGLPTYNFANVVDDHLMGITHVVRGTEYLSSAPKYNLLYQAFGWEVPAYIHVTPVMRDATHKLSKRAGDPTFEDLLAQGYLPQAIVNYVLLVGWAPGNDQEFFTLEEMCEAFHIKGLSRSPSIFDTNKLRWVNAEYLRRLSPAAFAEAAAPWLAKALSPGRVNWDTLCPLIQPRTEVFSDIPGIVDFLEALPDYSVELYTHKKMKTNPQIALTSLRSVWAVLRLLPDWNDSALHEALMGVVAELGLKNGQVMWPVRTAVSGKAATPGGAVELCSLLGRAETLDRLARGIQLLETVVEG